MRDHSFMDRVFARDDYDPDDEGEFIPNLVFVAMPFAGEGFDGVYSVIKEECAKPDLEVRREDENIGSGFMIDEISQLIENA